MLSRGHTENLHVISKQISESRNPAREKDLSYDRYIGAVNYKYGKIYSRRVPKASDIDFSARKTIKSRSSVDHKFLERVLKPVFSTFPRPQSIFNHIIWRPYNAKSVCVDELTCKIWYRIKFTFFLLILK